MSMMTIELRKERNEARHQSTYIHMVTYCKTRCNASYIYARIDLVNQPIFSVLRMRATGGLARSHNYVRLYIQWHRGSLGVIPGRPNQLPFP